MVKDVFEYCHTLKKKIEKLEDENKDLKEMVGRISNQMAVSEMSSLPGDNYEGTDPSTPSTTKAEKQIGSTSSLSKNNLAVPSVNSNSTVPKMPRLDLKSVACPSEHLVKPTQALTSNNSERDLYKKTIEPRIYQKRPVSSRQHSLKYDFVNTSKDEENYENIPQTNPVELKAGFEHRKNSSGSGYRLPSHRSEQKGPLINFEEALLLNKDQESSERKIIFREDSIDNNEKGSVKQSHVREHSSKSSVSSRYEELVSNLDINKVRGQSPGAELHFDYSKLIASSKSRYCTPRNVAPSPLGHQYSPRLPMAVPPQTFSSLVHAAAQPMKPSSTQPKNAKKTPLSMNNSPSQGTLLSVKSQGKLEGARIPQTRSSSTLQPIQNGPISSRPPASSPVCRAIAEVDEIFERESEILEIDESFNQKLKLAKEPIKKARLLEELKQKAKLNLASGNRGQEKNGPLFSFSKPQTTPSPNEVTNTKPEANIEPQETSKAQGSRSKNQVVSAFPREPHSTGGSSQSQSPFGMKVPGSKPESQSPGLGAKESRYRRLPSWGSLIDSEPKEGSPSTNPITPCFKSRVEN